MRRVIVESPFAPNVDDVPWWLRWLVRPLRAYRNRRYLRAAMRDCLLRGEAPFASHGLYTQPGVLCDEIPEERRHGIEAGLVWALIADATVVYTDLGYSKGMRYGIEHAKKNGRTLIYRHIK